MPGPVVHIGASAQCPHGMPVQIMASSKVLVGGMAAALQTDQGLVTGCPFMAGTKPQPCVTVKWLAGATRVTSNGVPLLINPSPGICQSPDQVPNGPPTILSTQTRVVAQ